MRHRQRLRLARTSFLAAALMVAATVTATPAATAAEPPLPDGARVDSFDGAALGGDWAVVNPVSDALRVADGRLTLTSQTGDTYQTTNTAKNVVLLDVPDADFTAVTRVSGAVAKTYQGAGLIALQDMDNYVRSGLTFVGTLSPSGRAIENDVETRAAFTAAKFTDRPGSTGETLRMRRTGNTVTTSYWDGRDWADAGTVTITFPITKIGLYALAATDGTTHEAAFDYFALSSAGGADQVPPGQFTFTTPYLTTSGDGLALTDSRPANGLALTATAAGGASGAVKPVTLKSGERPVVVRDGRFVLAEPGSTATALRLTDAGGGKVVLRTAADPESHAVRRADGTLGLGGSAEAAKLTVTPVSIAEQALTIDTAAARTEISDDLYGIFYEDINYAADGGLYAELVRNRSFEFNSSDNASFTGLTAWEAVNRGGATATTTVGTGDGRLNDNNRYFLTLTTTGAGAGIRNTGYNTGFAVKQGDKYDVSLWAKSSTAQDLTVRVEDTAGTGVSANGTLHVEAGTTWREHTVTLTATGTTSTGRFAVLAGAAGTLNLDMVSLMPQDTWVGAVNGKSVLRKDLAEKIAALEPRFLRFPGGCVTNVGTFDTYAESGGVDRQRTYQWKETIGPVEQRPTNFNFWGYNQSYGIGYLEYFEFAEDMGATALPVLSVGANGCGSRIPEMTDAARIQRWVDDTVDLIEFANGDTGTEWGAKRAALGHPEPFNLRYIGLGNEENTTTFEANFPVFRDAIKARYPDVTVISNSGPDDAGARFDALWAYNRAQNVEMVDEHYYNDPAWFLANNNRYDSYDRNGPHVFLGEYASRGNTMGNALSEASYMTGLERNGDLVELASYAPLLANESYVQWSPDAIWFDNDESWNSASYYVQQMFSANQGDQVVPSALTAGQGPEQAVRGGVFLSTWNTSAAYDNVKVTANGDGSVLFQDDFSATPAWQPQAGTWAVQDGQYAQTSTTTTDARSIIPDAYARNWSDYTLELDARKVSGAEGFLVGFGAGSSGDYYWWNLGGWNNTRQALERATGGARSEVASGPNTVIANDRTYKVKVVVEGAKISLYLDGALQLTYTQTAPQTLYQVVTADEETGDVVVKAVNPTGATARTRVRVDGGTPIAPTATVTEMSGPPTTVNTKAAPTAVAPVEREWTGASNDFTYDFPAYSVTFLRLHRAADQVPLTLTATPRCVGGAVHLAVTAVNTGTAAVAVAITTPYGTKSFPAVAPGKQAYQSFNTRTGTVPAGSVTATGTRDGRTATHTAAYPSTRCS
ncbi:carbohydrate binding domain-containing protein [Saccharothrix sp. 6-C]|uniref:alpha-L-arabinofuranosidase C-terminal domain-containing protein n=1 Tax=Saccharothrix sp. 6-C TaxID=2781735 RepID=UPI0019179DB0|nr:alpha-L-arabinofuranosidase C-terminal domain-containing protein [Saccharothrix sp. 6-C]QQQ73452.1 carbohydrate binding domain-containing protein [Saccharothrix sp. 6-C]